MNPLAFQSLTVGRLDQKTETVKPLAAKKTVLAAVIALAPPSPRTVTKKAAAAPPPPKPSPPPKPKPAAVPPKKPKLKLVKPLMAAAHVTAFAVGGLARKRRERAPAAELALPAPFVPVVPPRHRPPPLAEELMPMHSGWLRYGTHYMPVDNRRPIVTNTPGFGSAGLPNGATHGGTAAGGGPGNVVKHHNGARFRPVSAR